MHSQLYQKIPSLDLQAFVSGDAAQKQQFVAELGAAFHDIGFVAIKNHGLTDELTEKLYEQFKTFFALPDTIKKRYEIVSLNGQRGYVGKGKEHAKGRNTGDLKEFFHVGQEVLANDWRTDGYPQNIAITELPNLLPVAIEAFQTLERCGTVLLQAIALYLGLPQDYFDTKIEKGNSILRAIHYYPIDEGVEVSPDAVRAAEHGDINLITLLMGASADGLQILRRDGVWIPVTALPEQIIVNVGDMLDRHTNHKLKSTIHRVVNPPRELMHTSRYSIPFFMHPRSEMDLTCLPDCIDAANPKRYEDITAGDFLYQRLVEIGLIKK